MSIEEHLVQRWLNRGIRFFRAVTRNPVIRGALLERGLTNTELKHGWALYSNVLGFDETISEPHSVDGAAADAMARIDNWDAPNYAAMEAVLAYRLPGVFAYLFQGVSASTGPQALVGVERVLDRFASLKAGTAPGINAKDAKQAVQLLAERRIINEEIETELRELIRTAKSGAPPQPPPEPNDKRDAAFVAYRNWMNEWREVARTTISRRDYQIALGLASRRSRSAGDDSDDDTREEVVQAET